MGLTTIRPNSTLHFHKNFIVLYSSTGQINLMGFNHPLIFLLCSHQTKQWTVGHTFLFATIPKKKLCANSLLVIFSFVGKFLKYKSLTFILTSKKSLRLLGISTLNTPKIVVKSIIFLELLFFNNVWTSHLGFFCLF